jgi:hypothetical protein
MHRQIVMVLTALSKFKGYTFSRRVTYTHTHRPDPSVACSLLARTCLNPFLLLCRVSPSLGKHDFHRPYPIND